MVLAANNEMKTSAIDFNMIKILLLYSVAMANRMPFSRKVNLKLYSLKNELNSRMQFFTFLPNK